MTTPAHARSPRTARVVALLILAVVAGATGCSRSGPPSVAASCTVDQASLRALLHDATKDTKLALDRIDQQVCDENWVFVRATFTHSDGNAGESTAFLFHRNGQQWQLAYGGTAPLDAGDPLCGQLPARIKQADPVFRDGCPR